MAERDDSTPPLTCWVRLVHDPEEEPTRAPEDLVGGATGITARTRALFDATPFDPPSSESPRTEGRAPIGVAGAPLHGGSAARYEDCGPLGRGGMAEVRRAYDRLLGRVVALKILRSDHGEDPGLRARFLREARITGQLQHPCIPPVHDLGTLPDGRPWFTLKEVRGETLAAAIQAFRDGGGVAGPDGAAGLRRLVEALRAVAGALAFAHERGVVHRDLKPSNVMLGLHGEVLVLDWGIARAGGEVDLASVAWEEVPDAAPDTTQVGVVMGTRGFMAPEQAEGVAGPPADVYALGRILLRVLEAACGVRPAAEDASAPLWTLADAAVAGESELRPTARELVTRLVAWLDGSARRAEARALVREAAALSPDIDALRRNADALEEEAATLLAASPGHAPATTRVPAWRKQDEARRLRREASLLSVRREQLLHGALVRAEDLEEAHAAWADLLRAEHAAAEARRDEDAALAAETRLRAHVHALPAASAPRARHLEWLEGDGALTLLTDPPRARVRAFRYEERDRRLAEIPLPPLGRTPLVRVRLARGSYLLVVEAPGRVPVRYPVAIGRNGHWDGTPPEGGGPHPIFLPPQGAIGSDERYVPAGWFVCGGDPVAHEALPGHRAWVDGFVVRRDPVTNREYIAFLDDLVARGDDAEALRHVPRAHRRGAGEPSPVYGRHPDGRFRLVPDADGDLWDPEWPVVLVDQRSAWAFARWLGARDGLPWRLPGEHEWEKAARGVDGRTWPWGDHCDPAWVCIRESHAEYGRPARVGAHPADVSPYDVRGLGGNARDWCANVVPHDGRAIPDGRAPLPVADPLPPGTWAPARGGYWLGPERSSRAAARYKQLVELKNESIGIRLARSV